MITDNFDHAIIVLLCKKCSILENSDASQLIAKMLGIKLTLTQEN